MKARRVREIKLYPQNPVVEEIGATQQFRVVAFYEDGLVTVSYTHLTLPTTPYV